MILRTWLTCASILPRRRTASIYYIETKWWAECHLQSIIWLCLRSSVTPFDDPTIIPSSEAFAGIQAIAIAVLVVIKRWWWVWVRDDKNWTEFHSQSPICGFCKWNIQEATKWLDLLLPMTLYKETQTSMWMLPVQRNWIWMEEGKFHRDRNRNQIFHWILLIRMWFDELLSITN